ncbi:MAG: AF1514 family protein [Desulfobaccales bacterium]
MAECIPLTREMLTDPVDLCLPDAPLDFSRARALADRRAREMGGEPMLLAWYDRATGAFSPQVTCCTDAKPAWLMYAESRGGDLIIDINDEAYVFVYRRIL